MKKSLLNVISLTFSIAVSAQFSGAAEPLANLDAHVHGSSELTIVREGEALEIQLLSPAMNLVGFEHKANTPNQLAVVEGSKSQLSKPETLFRFSQGRCKPSKITVDVSSLIEKAHGEHNHNSHSSTQQYEQEVKPTEEHHQHHHDHVNKANHSEVVASYRYHCDTKSPVSAITVDLFRFFPGIQDIHVMWSIKNQQGAVTITPNNRMVEFR